MHGGMETKMATRGNVQFDFSDGKVYVKIDAGHQTANGVPFEKVIDSPFAL